MNKHNYVAILAGGLGTRFWPKSRAARPKQFLDILNVGKTLIQSTYERFAAFIPEENIFVITSDEFVPLVKEQLSSIQPENILSEPSRKNTAPCVAYISLKLLLKDPKASLIISPSDHLILDTAEFKSVTLKAIDFARHLKSLVTLGIQPSYPNTGYGYIQFETASVADNIYKVKTFTEKPDIDLARTFISSGEFLWNAGIFIWQVADIIKAFELHQPELLEFFTLEKESFNTPEEKNAIGRIYPQCTNISIDYAIMEVANNVYVIPSSFGWSDLGTWNSAYENLEKDYLGNAVAGNNIVVIDATKSVISAPNDKLVVIQGLDDFIVVDTKDVLLICKKEKEQHVKDYVAEVKRNKGDKFI